ncbi:MAG: haloacid dehalogenase, partial [Aquimarina sp.]|nr:haloacid dehalogenase [Aquimarina sp.]
MSYDIVFSDIDGTLLNAERELSNDTKAQIKRIKENIPVILISSRMPAAMVHLQKELDIENTPLICYNGGLILVENKTVHSTFISIEILENI